MAVMPARRVGAAPIGILPQARRGPAGATTITGVQWLVQELPPSQLVWTPGTLSPGSP